MKREGRGRLDNRGSALVSVLVVTVFISIIATTMLYVSAQNYQMKFTDYQNKQSFYGAEQALDSLKALLIRDVEDAYVAAYQEAMDKFLFKKTAQGRKEYYQEIYLKTLQEIWDTRLSGGDYAKKMQEFMKAEGVDSDVAERIYSVEGYGYGIPDTSTEKQFVIRGIRAKYTSGNYTTFLYTDIVLALPSLDLSVEASQTFSGTAEERKVIDLTDCVIYMNWRRADYEE